MAAQPFVLELHHLAGDDCFLVKVRAHDTNDLYRILKDEFGRFKAMSALQSAVLQGREESEGAVGRHGGLPSMGRETDGLFLQAPTSLILSRSRSDRVEGRWNSSAAPLCVLRLTAPRAVAQDEEGGG